MSEVLEQGAPQGEEALDDTVLILESLLFAAGDPVALDEMKDALPAEERDRAEAALEELVRRYDDTRSLQIVQVAGGYQMVTRSAYDRHIRALLRGRNRRRLGRASLETLAIVAYRQPVTGPEVSDIRGKDSSAVLKGLLDKQLIRITGRKKVVGKPFLYGTTRAFLMHFGLNALDDLPPMSEFEQMLSERMALLEEIPLPDEDSGGESPSEADAEVGSDAEE